MHGGPVLVRVEVDGDDQLRVAVPMAILADGLHEEGVIGVGGGSLDLDLAVVPAVVRSPDGDATRAGFDRVGKVESEGRKRVE